MSSLASNTGYRWGNGEGNCSHGYLMPSVMALLAREAKSLESEAKSARLFDLGCGNGSATTLYATAGWDVIGVDPSESGIANANASYPNLQVFLGSAYDDLVSRYGRFPVVVSLEVVEHVYAPRQYAATAFDLLEPGGLAVFSTPYHGYWKNLAMAISGKMDAHFTALWDHGHIKFWSEKTLSSLLIEAGFGDLRFTRVGRVPALAKSMICVARRPR